MPEKTRIRPPIIELASTRTKEFLREKEAMFWVFGFPLILALSLGFAFREKAPDRVPVGVVAGPNAQQRMAAIEWDLGSTAFVTRPTGITPVRGAPSPPSD